MWMDGGKKIYHGKLCDSSENHREKYSEESFCMNYLLDFFSMISMCLKLSDGHKNSSGGVRFFDGCEMAHGGGMNHSRRHLVANYLEGTASEI